MNVAAHMPGKKRWVGAAVVGAVVIMSLIPGWRWWAEDATHNRSQRFIDAAGALEQLGTSLSGVIVHDEYWDTDVRTLHNLHVQRREELPTYALLPDHLRAISTHASLADLTDIPVVNWTPLTSLAPGTYAVISIQRTCTQLPVRYGRWSPAEIELGVRGTAVCTLQPGTRNPQ